MTPGHPSLSAEPTDGKLDELDQRIVEALRKDARQSSRRLGATLDVPPSTVRRRLNRLLRDNVIKVVTLMNPFSAGYNIWANIGVFVAPGMAPHVAERLLQFSQCYTILICLGRYDVLVAAHFRSVSELNRFLNEQLPKIEGVTRSETALVTQPRRYYDFLWSPEDAGPPDGDGGLAIEPARTSSGICSNGSKDR